MTADQRIFEAVPTSAQRVRRFVTAALLADGADEASVQNLTLVASELASNVIEHGDGSQVVVAIDSSDAAWWAIEVCGGRPVRSELTDPVAWRLPAPHDPSGRGLALVRQLVDEIRIDNDENGPRISCRIRRR
jgi:anti-sigma regulatory factor (Ser/Thr protein kinase)